MVGVRNVGMERTIRNNETCKPKPKPKPNQKQNQKGGKYGCEEPSFSLVFESKIHTKHQQQERW